MLNPSGKRNTNRTKTELTDLDRAIHELFSFASTTQVNDGMWSWLKATVCGNFNTDLEESEKVFILILYEHLEKVLTAAEENYQLHKKQIHDNY